jgi:hypothetical protein
MNEKLEHLESKQNASNQHGSKHEFYPKVVKFYKLSEPTGSK